MRYSRGASALGVGLALGEIEERKLSVDVICRDWRLYSKVASTSAGIELLNCEIIVMGNSSKVSGDLIITYSAMGDSIDTEAVSEALKNAGITNSKDLTRIINVFVANEM